MKREIFELQAEICRTLANPKRLEILSALKEGELFAGELVERLGIAKANLSQHLSVLRQRKVVRTRRSGVNIFYSINNPKIIEACSIMRAVLMEQLEENERLAKRVKR